MTDIAAMGGKRILIVEDDFYIVEEMMEEFEAAGTVVVGPVAGSQDALDLIESGAEIDAAVLDINLQGELSFVVADALRQRHVPFVFATGYDRSSVKKTYGDAIVCEKPVSPASVCQALFGARNRSAQRF